MTYLARCAVYGSLCFAADDVDAYSWGTGSADVTLTTARRTQLTILEKDNNALI